MIGGVRNKAGKTNDFFCEHFIKKDCLRDLGVDGR